MTETDILSTKSDFWHKNDNEFYDIMSGVGELISEETRPLLCSLTMSECSNATIDLDSPERSDNRTNCGPTPMENNFVNEKAYKSMYDIMEPNETSMTESANDMNQSLNNKFRKCLSMHDVSNILPLPLTAKSVNTVSCETIHSQSLSSTTKSKDSGFQRSVSFVSLTSGRRNYDHVQSKVKAYIMNIKESEANRKRNKLLQKIEVISEPVSLVDEIDMVLDKEDLVLKIQELKHELEEKAMYIDAQQRNYNNLLLKLAEAKNTIDSLRLKRISLNYSSSMNDGSQNLSSQFKSIDFDFLESELNKRAEANKSTKMEITFSGEVTQIKGQRSLSLETTNSSLTEVFRPKKHSTPKGNEAKSLSPVSKMFSSSLRLDKNYKPLGNLKQGHHTSGTLSQSVSNRNTQLECSQCQARKARVTAPGEMTTKSKSSAAKPSSNSSCSLQKTPSSHLDLPNDNPFDKVKKWQASLPSINLMGTHSSSDCELSETRPPCKTDPTIVRSKEDDVDISCLLSQELVTKCTISHMEVNSVADNSSHRPKSRALGVKHVKNEKFIKLPSFTNNLSNDNLDSNIERSKSEKVTKQLNYTNDVRFEKTSTERKPVMSEKLFKNQEMIFPALINFRDSSISDSESHHPKSSCATCTVDQVVDDDHHDESSSISSSVLGSTASSSVTLPIKRKSDLNEPKVSTKVPKSSRTNVILRKPRLNVTLNIPQIKTVKSHTKAADSKNSSNRISYLKTESSERRAWNNRNNTNFFVCKEFYFKKSSSLEDCLNIMEGMVQKGSSIIETALDRTHC